MVEVDGHSCRRLQERTGSDQFDLGRRKKTCHQSRLLRQNLSTLRLLPEDIGAFGNEEIGRDELPVGATQGERLRSPFLLYQPFHRNAGVYDRARSRACPPPPRSDSGGSGPHRRDRASRNSFSEGVCFRLAVRARSWAASLSKSISASLSSAWRRISRCSASTERPWRAARRFSSQSRRRGCAHGGGRACGFLARSEHLVAKISWS